jgi:hypothetical protein
MARLRLRRQRMDFQRDHAAVLLHGGGADIGAFHLFQRRRLGGRHPDVGRQLQLQVFAVARFHRQEIGLHGGDRAAHADRLLRE